MEAIFPMYDEESLVSVDYAVIDKTDDKFRELYNSNTLYDLTAKYIKARKEIFID